MEIRIHPHVIKRHQDRVRMGGAQDWPLEWQAQMEAVAGKWLEVETDHLFENQFNTVAVPGVSENGMRVMIIDVVEIRGDVREGIVKCEWCFGYDTTENNRCDECGKSDYLKILQPEVPPSLTPKELVIPKYPRGRDGWDVSEDYILAKVKGDVAHGIETQPTKERAERAAQFLREHEVRIQGNPDAIRVLTVASWSGNKVKP